MQILNDVGKKKELQDAQFWQQFNEIHELLSFQSDTFKANYFKIGNATVPMIFS